MIMKMMIMIMIRCDFFQLILVLAAFIELGKRPQLCHQNQSWHTEVLKSLEI